MSDGPSITIDSEVAPQTGTEQITRRGFFRRGGSALTRIAAIAAATTVAAKDLHLPSEHDESYAHSSGLIRVIPALHSGDGSEGNTFIKTGDLKISQWNNAALKTIDDAMRKAKREERSTYCIGIDGIGQKGISERQLLWPLIPHPDLNNPNAYPRNIHILGLDTDTTYGLNGLEHTLTNNSLRNEFIQEVKGWYAQPGLENGVNPLAHATVEGAIIYALIKTGLPSVKRRSILKALGGIAAFEVVKNAGELGHVLSALTSDPETQRFITTVSTTMTNDKALTNDLAVRARTALAIEKALYVSDNLVNEKGSSKPTPVDLLYGSSHGIDLPQLSEDRSHRLETIEEFMKTVLTRFDLALNTRYQEFLPQRNEILTAAAKSFLTIMMYRANMPWGKTSIPANETLSFDYDAVALQGTPTCTSLIPLTENILQEFGINQSPL